MPSWIYYYICKLLCAYQIYNGQKLDVLAWHIRVCMCGCLLSPLNSLSFISFHCIAFFPIWELAALHSVCIWVETWQFAPFAFRLNKLECNYTHIWRKKCLAGYKWCDGFHACMYILMYDATCTQAPTCLHLHLLYERVAISCWIFRERKSHLNEKLLWTQHRLAFSLLHSIISRNAIIKLNDLHLLSSVFEVIMN